MPEHVIAEVRRRRLTYLSERKLQALAGALSGIEQRRLPGVLVEAGCALGGSTIVMAAARHPRRPLRVHDVFGTIPPPTAEDPPEVHERWRVIAEGRSAGIGGDRYYGYVDDLYDVVQANLRSFGIEPQRDGVDLVPGLLQHTLWPCEPVALAHIDVDWYAPVSTCLQRLFPWLVQGGSLVLDDYHDWGGCRRAVDEFLAVHGHQCALDDRAGSLIITRLADEAAAALPH
jgi:asparagine synthase (glutamine-hydrolysing)